jgi:hypothetical protein
VTLSTYAHLFKLDDSKSAEAVNQALANCRGIRQQRMGSKSAFCSFGAIEIAAET